MPKRKAGDMDHQFNIATSRIQDANDLDLPAFKDLHLPASFHCYTPTASTANTNTKDLENSTFSITLTTSSDLESDELNACFDLIDFTSGAAYRGSSWGWHPFRKRREMRETDMRYLLVRRQRPDPVEPATTAIDATSKPEAQDAKVTVEDAVAEQETDGAEEDWSDSDSEPPNTDTSIEGFLSFMLSYEDGYEVIYIYEIHLRPSLRSLGLGAHLMRLAEHVGRSVGVQKSMLTCFRSNEAAEKWYRRRDYEEDENSPREKKLRGGKLRKVDYLIMSKWLGAQQ